MHHPIFGPVILILTPLVLLYSLLILLGVDAGRLPVWAGSAMLFRLVFSMEVHYLPDFVRSKIMYTGRELLAG